LIAKKLKELSFDDITDEVFAEISQILFLHFNKTQKILRKDRPEACFKYDIWEKRGASIHFKNAAVPNNPFKDDELAKRKAELRGIAQDIKDNHPEIEFIFSVSWMWNLKIFKDLMPKEFVDSLEEHTDNEYYSDGHWGQFYRYDGTLNKERMLQFRKSWEFPLKILLGKCNVKDFFRKCL
jgi:hypothetical protein